MTEEKSEDTMIIQDILGTIKEAVASYLLRTKELPTDPDKYLYVPDRNKPSTWKLPVHDLKHMQLAAAALSGGGMMGNPVKLPSGVKAKLRAKLRRMFSSMGEEPPDSLKKEAPLYVWKDDSGQWRWIANYSNNFRDNDHPSEIIAGESHLKFVEMVDNKETPMPELWHWHVPGTKWGQAEWVAYDEDNGIAMAAGIILEGHEKEAQALEDSDMDIGVSHGMPSPSIVRDTQDSSIIVRHITREISDLPLWAAANKLTSFHVFKETDEMAIPDKKREYLKGIGVSEEQIKELEAINEQTKQVAEELKIESKEETKEEAAPVVETESETKTESKEDVKAEVQFVTGEQLAEAITAITKAVTDALTGMSDKMTAMQDELKEMKEKESKETVDPRAIPSASLAALIAQGMSAVGNDKTRISKKEAKAMNSPEETEAESKTKQDFGNPVVNQVIANITGLK